MLAAADVRNLAEAAKAAAKLAEIDRQLAALKGNGRVEQARAYVKDQLKKLKLASHRGRLTRTVRPRTPVDVHPEDAWTRTTCSKLLDLDGKAARPPEPTGPSLITPAEPTPPAADAEPDGAGGGRVGPAAGPRPGRRERAAAGRPAPTSTPPPTSSPPRSSPTRGCVERCADARRHEFLAQLLETPGVPRPARRHPAGRHRRRRSPPPTSPSSSPTLEDGGRRRATPPATAATARWRRCGPSAGRWPRPARRSAELHEAAAALGLGPGSPGRNDPTADRRAVPAGAGRPGAAADLRAGRPVPPGGPVEAAAEGDARPGRRGRGRAGRRRRPAAARPSWPSSRSPSWNSTPCGGSSSGRPCAASTTPSSRSARGRSSSSVDESGSHAGREGPHRQGAGPGPGLGRPAAAAVVRAGRLRGDSGERLLALPPGRWDEARSWTGSPRSSAAGRPRRAGPGDARTTTAELERPAGHHRRGLRHRRPVPHPGRRPGPRSWPGSGRPRPGSSPW